MRSHALSFPFDIPNLFNGFGEARGVARLEGDEVVLEYEVRESILNVFKGEVQEARIPLAEINWVDFSTSWFSAKLVLACRTMKCVSGVPGMEQGKVTLNVAKSDRPRAQEFGTAINLWMSERALQEAMPPDRELGPPE
jgi:hypothetical protein